MLKWLQSMLEDNSGGVSTMRVCLLLWIIVLSFNITYGTLTEKPFPVTGELVALTACIFGAKAIQRFGEKTEITFDSNGQITQANGVNVSQLPLTVSVQGSVPVAGQIPISAQQPQQQIIIQPPVTQQPQPTVPTVPTVPGQGVSIP